MMASVPGITAVSYLNTIPFIYGIEHAAELGASLLLAPPSQCAENYIAKKADIALLPAAAVPSLSATEILPDYCIGACNAVRTVVLLSNCPLSAIRRIWLDPHSLTSVQLCGYLARHRWKIAPEWLALDDYARTGQARPDEAFLLIGDKVFDYEGKFLHAWDLAEEWIAQTSLPFAFAVWVARKGTPNEVLDALREALTFGVEHTWEAVLKYGFDKKPYDAYDYLTRNIDYLFDYQKRKALDLFWDDGMKIAPRANPG